MLLLDVEAMLTGMRPHTNLPPNAQKPTKATQRAQAMNLFQR